MGESVAFVAVVFGTAVAAGSGITNELLAGGAFVAIIAGVVGAIFTSKYKAALRASEGAASAWKEERDAERSKAERLAEALRDAETKRVAAEARTDITRLEKLVTRQHDDIVAVLDAIKDSLRAVTTAVEFMSKHSYSTDMPPGD